jgi:hypothetical protein
VERAWSKFRGEVPGQKFLDAVDGMIGDTFEHVAQISLGI